MKAKEVEKKDDNLILPNYNLYNLKRKSTKQIKPDLKKSFNFIADVAESSIPR